VQRGGDGLRLYELSGSSEGLQQGAGSDWVCPKRCHGCAAILQTPALVTTHNVLFSMPSGIVMHVGFTLLVMFNLIMLFFF